MNENSSSSDIMWKKNSELHANNDLTSEEIYIFIYLGLEEIE